LYGKVFDSIYDGTLYGHWEAIVTMQQLVVLASPDGVIDMTPNAIAARTSIPLDIIRKGLTVLESPDPYSRTPGDEGRRIVPLDDHRPWGWRLVNHGKYMRLRNMAEKREADRSRIAEKRKENNDVAIVSQNVANVAHSDSDLDTDKDVKRKALPPSGAFLRFWGVWPKSMRKGSRGECWDRWRRNDFDLAAEEIISHVESLKRSADWRKNDGEFIPAPAVYLRQKRWEGADELEPVVTVDR
jgi:hypothetical protein